MEKTTQNTKHKTIYYLKKNTLQGCPMQKKGGYDKETCGPIETAPAKHRKGHETALKRLGIPPDRIPHILNKIEYH